MVQSLPERLPSHNYGEPPIWKTKTARPPKAFENNLAECPLIADTGGMDESTLLSRITYNPQIFNGKAIVRGRRLAVEHVIGMLASGHTFQDLHEDFPWLDREDIQACLIYAKRAVGNERFEPVLAEAEA